MQQHRLFHGVTDVFFRFQSASCMSAALLNYRPQIWLIRTLVTERCCALKLNSLSSCRSSGTVLSFQSPIVFVSTRDYGKKPKESKKESAKKGKHDKVALSPEEENLVIDFESVKGQMKMTLDHLKKEYLEQLTLRTSVGTLDSVQVKTPDGSFPLSQLAQVVQKSPQLMMINMISNPQHIVHVKEAVVALSLNPQQEGTTLFVTIPKVTREHRESLAKSAKAMCEKTKEKLRNIQNNSVKLIKKAKEGHSEDAVHRINEALLSLTREHVELAEAIMRSKQDELVGNQ